MQLASTWAVVWLMCGLSCACSTSSRQSHAMRDAGPGDRDSATKASRKCGDTSRLLVDYFAAVPKADEAPVLSVQSPSIAVNSKHLYFLLNWEDRQGHQGCLMRLTFGADRSTCVSSIPGGGSSASQSIVASDHDVFFGRAAPREQTSGALDRLDENGDRVTTLTETRGELKGLVVNSDRVFFADDDGTRSVRIDGGEQRLLSSSHQTYSLGLVGSTLYMGGSSLTSVAVDGGDASIVANEPALYPLACDDAVCWIAGAPLAATLARLGKDGHRTTLAPDVTEAHALLYDGNNFFVTVGAVGLSLLRVPVAGGSSFLVATEPATSLALDDDCLYWAGAAGIFSISRAVADVADVR